MKVGVVGVGEMGLAMAGHLLGQGPSRSLPSTSTRKARRGPRARRSQRGEPRPKLAEVADVFILVVATDEQVTTFRRNSPNTPPTALSSSIAATISPETMLRARTAAAQPRGKRFVDAPVVYGAPGAREGTLLSLCGGSETDVERIRPALMGYSRDVMHVGPAGPVRSPNPATTSCIGCIASPTSRRC